MKTKKIYVYCIYFPTSNKYYIGQTNDLKRRMRDHLNSKSNSLVGNALNKYDDWQISILHTRINRDEINLLEIESIRNFNTIRPYGYNLTAGGEGLFNPCREVRNKIANALQGNKNGEGERSKEFCEEMRILNIGNQNAIGKKPETSAALKKNNPMKDPKNVLKWKISKLKNLIEKLERDKNE